MKLFDSLAPQTETAATPAPSLTGIPGSPAKPKVVVQQVGRPTSVENEPQRATVANGQQPSQPSQEPNQTSPNKFVLTPDYIQQSKREISVDLIEILK